MPEPAHFESLTREGNEHGQGGRPLAPLPPMPLPTTFDALVDGDRLIVMLRGELDLDTGRRLRPGLRHTLSRSARVIELDLSGVGFCDCSGLNVLLNLRQWALEQGKVITIGSNSRAVERMLELTGTRHLFASSHPEDSHPGEEHSAEPAAKDADQRAESVEDLRTVVAQLRRAMQTRPTIDLARGILMSSYHLSPEAAWDVLVTASQNTNTKLYRLAGDLVDTAQGSELPEAVREQLVAAVARTTAEHSLN
ncbi:anti-sigma factor antagonist [Streptomyces sp. NPDC003006]